MKKVLLSILLVSYTFASSGASVDLHYCMGKLIGWDLDYSKKTGCVNCKMEAKPGNDCCDNKQIHPKVDKDQQAVFNNISFCYDHSAIISHYIMTNDVAINTTTIFSYAIHAPPIIPNNTTYLLNCNFRI